MARYPLIVVLSLFVALAPAFAEGRASQTPLPAGKPAGTKQAQITTNGIIFVGAGVLALGLGLFLASHPYKLPGQSSAPSTSP